MTEHTTYKYEYKPDWWHPASNFGGGTVSPGMFRAMPLGDAVRDFLEGLETRDPVSRVLAHLVMTLAQEVGNAMTADRFVRTKSCVEPVRELRSVLTELSEAPQ